MSSYVDAHCHLADPRFDGIDDVMERSLKAGVSRWIQGGVDPQDWDRQLELRRRFGGGVLPVFGLHPWWVIEHFLDIEIETAFERLESQLHLAVALGELGLDFGPRSKGPEDRERQTQVFREQLKLADRFSKPIVLHIVRAHEEAIKVLQEHRVGPGVGSNRGIVHSFSGDESAAAAYVQLGLGLSISGAVTKKGYTALKKAVKTIPGECLVIETDAPDQAPEASKLNEPSSLIRVAQAVGAIRDESAETILKRSTENLERIFKLTP